MTALWLLACTGGTATAGDSATPTETGEAPPLLWDLTAEGSRWQRFHHEEDFHLNVVRDDLVVVATHSTVLTGDVVSVSFPQLLEHGRSYVLDYYADHNGDGICSDSPSPADHVWHHDIGRATEDLDVVIDHEGETMDFEGCASFE